MLSQTTPLWNKRENVPPSGFLPVLEGLLRRFGLAAASAALVKEEAVGRQGLPGVEDACFWNKAIALFFPWLPPLTLRTSPYRVSRKPSHRWRSGGLDTLFLPGHRAAVAGGSAARARGASARELLHQRMRWMRSSTWDSQAAPSLYQPLLSHTLWVYASPHSSSF